MTFTRAAPQCSLQVGDPALIAPGAKLPRVNLKDIKIFVDYVKVVPKLYTETIKEIQRPKVDQKGIPLRFFKVNVEYHPISKNQYNRIRLTALGQKLPVFFVVLCSTQVIVASFVERFHFICSYNKFTVFIVTLRSCDVYIIMNVLAGGHRRILFQSIDGAPHR